MLKGTSTTESYGQRTCILRIMSYPTCNRRHVGYKMLDIVSTDIGFIGKSPLMEERITMELSVKLLDVSETWEGNTLVRLSCPNNIPQIAVVGATPNVLSATSGNGVITVTLKPGQAPYFTIDFKAAVTEPYDAILSGTIHSVPDPAPAPTPTSSRTGADIVLDIVRGKDPKTAASKDKSIKLRCNIDFSTITADIATGSSS